MDLPCLKHMFRFRLSAPSFIYPAGYVENVQRLGSHLDEIEVLLLESRPGTLPSSETIAELAHLADVLKVDYNVHLPIDLDPGAPDQALRTAAVDRLAEALKLAAPLSPTTHTVHLPFNADRNDSGSIAAWQARTIESLDRLVNTAAIEPCQLSIETLDYPHTWFAPILEALPCTICIDIGHILLHGLDLKTVLHDLASRTVIVHLHAVAEGTDHHSLDHLENTSWEALHPFMTDFEGSVSLEVFSVERLHVSMVSFGRLMGNA